MTLTTPHLQNWPLVSRGPDWRSFIKLGEGERAKFLIRTMSRVSNNALLT